MLPDGSARSCYRPVCRASAHPHAKLPSVGSLLSPYPAHCSVVRWSGRSRSCRQHVWVQYMGPSHAESPRSNDCATHLPCASPGVSLRTAFCCAGYTPEVLAVLRRLRARSTLCASEPLTRDSRVERSLSLDGVTTAYRYVHQDDGEQASVYDVGPKSPCCEYIFP